ncbi:hypothetical protein M378DRAFT_701485 [Amanita muscaria Koide BX008]|uniref:Uncharacterized protein n=1 Tax=Amanita muscaria (strain Koide BX008) TaxID=946122 RepID=A0A0C2XJT9_AMAMK|nr:hypothetical protein M378DRAFT_701485 [Amanita muscaria Koide BX008]
MMSPTRYVFLAFAIIVRSCALFALALIEPVPQISLHFILTISHAGYGRVTSWDNIKSQIKGSNPLDKDPVPDEYYVKGTQTPARKANAAIVILGKLFAVSCSRPPYRNP